MLQVDTDKVEDVVTQLMGKPAHLTIALASVIPFVISLETAVGILRNWNVIVS